MKLVPCASCARHVRADESACPFCQTARVPCTGLCLEREAALSRAALLFVGATALAGCGKSGKDPMETSGGVVAPYAAAPVDAAAMPMIEAPPIQDAGAVPVVPPKK